MTTNKINLNLTNKVVFNETFTINMGVYIALSDDKARLTIKPIKELGEEFAEDGAIVVAKLVCKKLNDKGIYPCRTNSTLELTLRHRKFEVNSLNTCFLVSVIDTDVYAVMTEDKD